MSGRSRTIGMLSWECPDSPGSRDEVPPSSSGKDGGLLWSARYGAKRGLKSRKSMI